MLLTATQVAEKLRITPNTVRKMCAEGRLVGKNVARKGNRAMWRVDEKDLRAFRETQRANGDVAPVEKAKVVPDGYVSTDVAAQKAGTSRSAISYRVAHGKLAAVRIGRAYYVPLQDVAPGRNAETPAATPADAPAPRGVPTLLREIIERLAQVHYFVAGCKDVESMERGRRQQPQGRRALQGVDDVT
jgi:hypothetical protein